MKKLADGCIQQVLALYKEGKTCKEVSVCLKISIGSVSNILRKHNAVRSASETSRYPFEALSHIWSVEFKNGVSIEDIASKYNTTNRTVRAKLRKLGTLLSFESSENERSELNNHTYFDEINTEHKAYWLGFILADGYVSNDYVSFTLGIKDKEHLSKIASVFNKTVKTRIRKKTYRGADSYKEYASLSVNSRRLCNSLQLKGLIPNKSLSTGLSSCFKYVPENLLRHFIRGIFDGDGCVSMNRQYLRMAIVGEKGVLETISYILHKTLSIEKPNLYKKDSIYCISIDAKKKLLIVSNYLYKDATVWLERKRDIFVKHGYLDAV